MAKVPKELHRYMRLERGLETLSSGELYLSHAYYNDPFELTPASKYFTHSETFYQTLMENAKTEEEKKALEESGIKDALIGGGIAVGAAAFFNPYLAVGIAGLYLLGLFSDDKEEKQSEFERCLLFYYKCRPFIERTKLCSFSSSYDDLLMWSHYAKHIVSEGNGHYKIKEHAGMVITFSTNVKYWGDAIFKEMIYSDNRLELPDNETNFWNYVGDIFTRKSKCWQYEKEWRLLKSDFKGNRLPFAPESVKAIRLGMYVSEDIKEATLKLRDMKYKDVPVYLARRSDRDYKIEFDEL